LNFEISNLAPCELSAQLDVTAIILLAANHVDPSLFDKTAKQRVYVPVRAHCQAALALALAADLY
jgi:hypothetical protein